MSKIFLVSQAHELTRDFDIMGAFSTKEKAEEAVKRYIDNEYKDNSSRRDEYNKIWANSSVFCSSAGKCVPYIDKFPFSIKLEIDEYTLDQDF